MTTIPATLEEYLTKFSGLLSQQASANSNPLHTPGKDAVVEIDLKRKPFPAQAHLISAAVKYLSKHKSIMVSAATGSGKSLMSIGIVHAKSRGKPYRCLVFCPPHLVKKWKREIENTVPGRPHVHIVESYRDLPSCGKSIPRVGSGWWIVSNTTAKLGSRWKPIYMTGGSMSGKSTKFRLCNIQHIGGIKHPQVKIVEPSRGTQYAALGSRMAMNVANGVYCQACLSRQEKEDKETGIMEPMDAEDFHKRRRNCLVCGSPMWQWSREGESDDEDKSVKSGKIRGDRWPVATFVHKKLSGFFDVAIIDESHLAKSGETAIGNAVGSLAAACKSVIAMSGTVLGGYAWHLMPLMFRLNPKSLLDEGIGWKDTVAFNERYGRMERKVTETKTKDSRGNRQSKGASQRTQKYVRPGVMPQLFGRHLMQQTVFLELGDISDSLPPLRENIISVPMDMELAIEYKRIEEALSKAMKEMLRKGNKRLLGTMLSVLLGYPDHPWDYGTIAYQNEDESWTEVVKTRDLPQVQRNKEAKLLELCLERKRQGRQCWVYGVMVDKRDVLGRLAEMLAAKGLRVDVLRSSVSTGAREEWIAKNGPSLDVCLSHPQLVETGLDLFDVRGGHNFASLVFYEAGYNLFTMRQAAGRHFRIGQTLPCETLYMFYEQTMQARAMTLMAKKLAASQLIEGKFTTEGLIAMAGDEGTMEIALAKSLVEKMDDLDGGSLWERYNGDCSTLLPEPIADTPQVVEAPPMRRPEVRIETLPILTPGSMWRPKTGVGFPIEIMECSGKFADFREMGRKSRTTLAVIDILARYKPMGSEGAAVTYRKQKELW